MGPVVTINSATLVNKGLEVIEAHELFDIGYDQIEVIVHPQSVVHSMVEFVDGVDDRPVQPARYATCRSPWRWAGRIGYQSLSPCRLDGERNLAISATWMRPLFLRWRWRRPRGGQGVAFLRSINAANEECVSAFSPDDCRFLAIVDTVERVLAETPDFAEPGTVEDVLAAEAWARTRAREIVAVVGKGA